LAISSTFVKSALALLSVLILVPLAAHAQGSPFETGLNALQGLFTGTVAKVASLIAIVIGGYGFLSHIFSMAGSNTGAEREASQARAFGARRASGRSEEA
jgi:type IV secretory pathway VirB2 component (pilin)